MSHSNQITITRSNHDKQNPYVLISREMLADKEISPKAKGVLCYLLSLPDDWKLYHSQLQQALGIGEDYLNSAMEELLQAGYAKRNRLRIKGKFQAYTYEISESKIFQPNRENQPGSTGPVNPGILNNERVISDDDDSEHAPNKNFEENQSPKDSPEKNPNAKNPVESNSPQKISAENAHIKNETCAKIVRGKTISVSKTAELMRLKNLHSIATVEDLEETWQRFVDAEDEISDVKAYLLTILKKVCKKTATQNNNRGKSCRTKRIGQKTTQESTKNLYSEDTIVEQLSSQEKERFQRFLARK